jgi:hypothetical protein
MCDSDSESETDDEPEYPTQNDKDDVFGISKQIPTNPPRKQRLRTSRASRKPAFETYEELSAELDLLNKAEAKCGAPQVSCINVWLYMSGLS